MKTDVSRIARSAVSFLQLVGRIRERLLELARKAGVGLSPLDQVPRARAGCPVPAILDWDQIRRVTSRHGHAEPLARFDAAQDARDIVAQLALRDALHPGDCSRTATALALDAVPCRCGRVGLAAAWAWAQREPREGECERGEAAAAAVERAPRPR